MKKTAILFPGQGSQYVGMGKDFIEADPEAVELMELADRITGFPLRRLCFDGPLEELTRAHHLQPAITAINMVCWQALKKAVPELRPAFFAGHSLGEYSALYAAEVVSAEDCVSLVTRRGELTEREGQANPGRMWAVLGMTVNEIDNLLGNYAGGTGTVVIANHNAEKQVVISGDQAGLEGFGALCESHGAKIIPLNVGVANHSPLVAGAVGDFVDFMTGIRFNAPKDPVLFNVTADEEKDPSVIRDIMARHIASRVRWYEIVLRMLAHGVEVFVEVGPKKVLTGLVRKTAPKDSVDCVHFDNAADLEKVVAKLIG